MMKKLRRGFDAWGHYLLALLCAGVILLSAAWTREQRTGEAAGQQAVSDQSQRLNQVTEPEKRETLIRPVAGEILRGYSEEAVYFPALRLWQTHRAVDFAAGEGEAVRAMLEGTVISAQDGCVRLRHENGLESLYRGLKLTDVSPGDVVRQGAVIGRAGARVSYEGTGHICVSFMENGVPLPIDFP